MNLVKKKGYRQPASELPGVKTWVSEPSQKDLTPPTSESPENNFETRPDVPENKQQALPITPKHKKEREKHQPTPDKPSKRPTYNAPPPSCETDGKPLHKRPRTKAVPGEEYGHPWKDDGSGSMKRRVDVTAASVAEKWLAEKVDEAFRILVQGGLTKVFPSSADRQKSQKGKAKIYYQKYYRRNRGKVRMKAKRRYRKIKNRTDYKRDVKYRRKYPDKYKRRPSGVSENKDRAKKWREKNKGEKKADGAIPKYFNLPTIRVWLEDYDGEAKLIFLNNTGMVSFEYEGEIYDVPFEQFMEEVIFQSEEDEERFFNYLDWLFDYEEAQAVTAAVRQKPRRRQRKQRGLSRVKSRMRYRKNRNRNRIKAKQRYRKRKNQPAFKRQRKIRRKHPQRFKRRNAGVLTAPEIAFVIGQDMELGYVHSVSPLSAMVTFNLAERGVFQSLSVPVFLCSVVFLSEQDIDAMFELIDTEVGDVAYADLTPEAVEGAEETAGIDLGSEEFQKACEALGGKMSLSEMTPEELERVDSGIVDGVFENAEQGKEDPHEDDMEGDEDRGGEYPSLDDAESELIDPTDDDYIYGIVNIPQAVQKIADVYIERKRPSDRMQHDENVKGVPSGEDQNAQEYTGTRTWVVPMTHRPGLIEEREVKSPGHESDYGQVDNNPGSAKVIPSGHDFENKKAFNARVAAKISEIINTTGPKIRTRAEGLKVDLERVLEKNWIYFYRVQGSKAPYRVKIKFLKKGNTRDHKKLDVRVTCSCNFWQWQGPEHWAKADGYLYGKARGTAANPTVRDPQGDHKACKHVIAVLDRLAKKKMMFF